MQPWEVHSVMESCTISAHPLETSMESSHALSSRPAAPIQGSAQRPDVPQKVILDRMGMDTLNEALLEYVKRLDSAVLRIIFYDPHHNNPFATT
jgi:hypothetical protein